MTTPYEEYINASNLLSEKKLERDLKPRRENDLPIVLRVQEEQIFIYDRNLHSSIMLTGPQIVEIHDWLKEIGFI